MVTGMTRNDKIQCYQGVNSVLPWCGFGGMRGEVRGEMEEGGAGGGGHDAGCVPLCGSVTTFGGRY